MSRVFPKKPCPFIKNKLIWCGDQAKCNFGKDEPCSSIKRLLKIDKNLRRTNV